MVSSVAVHGIVLCCVTVADGEWKMYQRSASHMGTQWHAALYAEDPETANQAFDRAFALVEAIDRALTNYQPDSELNRLCRSAPHERPVPVSDHLWRVLHEADRLSRLTGGAFDVTIGPLSKRWRQARAKKRLPSAEDLAEAQARVGYQAVEFTPASHAVRLLKPGMQLDLGGIAKGYAVDQALEAMGASGVQSALMNGGGDLAVSGPPPHAAGWRVQVAGLGPQALPREIELHHAAIATSGDAWQYLEIDGQRYSHIIDPHTGIGLTNRVSVSVIARTCMVADAWASALCVMPSATALATNDDPSLAWLITTVAANGQPHYTSSPRFPTTVVATPPTDDP